MDFWQLEHLELKLKLPLGAGVNKGDKSKCKWITSSRSDILVRDSCVIHLSCTNMITRFITLYVQLVSLVVEMFPLFKFIGRKLQHRRKVLSEPTWNEAKLHL